MPYDVVDIDFELRTLTYTHLIMASFQDQGFQVLSTSLPQGLSTVVGRARRAALPRSPSKSNGG